MPVIFRIGRYKVYIYPGDHGPAHIHVYGPEESIKFLIKNLECIEAKGINFKDLNKLRKILKQQQNYFMEIWNEIQEN